MDFRHLETFLKIAELKSFTKAAEELYLTQPTVSKQVVDLERFFDIKLIDRTKRAVTLTRAGEILLDYARDFVNLKKETMDAIADFRGLKTGTIHIGASNIPGVYILPRALKEFKARYGGIQVRLTISDTRDVTQKTEEGKIDIGFVGARDPSRPLEYRPLLDDRIVLIAPPDYPDSLSLDRLKGLPFIIREGGSGTRRSFDAFLARLHMESSRDLNVVAEMSDTEATKEAVKSGLGMAYASRMAIDGELSRGTLKIVDIEGVNPLKRSFYIITRKGRTILPQVKALITDMEAWKKGKSRAPASH